MKFNSSKLVSILFYAGCTLIVGVQLWLCLFRIASYWQWGHNGYNGAAYQVAARNSIRFKTIWPAQYHTTSDTEPEPSEYYTHAPLGLHWFTTLSVFILGDHEVSVRLVPAVFSLLATLMFLILLTKHYSRPLALVIASIYVLLPINTIYCNMSNHSTGCIFFALLMFDGYLDWLKTKKNTCLIRIFIGLGGATLFDWPGYTLSICLGIAAFYEGMKAQQEKGFVPRKELLFSLSVFLLIILLFKGYLNWISTLRGIDDVLVAISTRSASANIIQTIRDLYGSVISAMFPRLLRMLAFVWLFRTIIKHARGTLKKRDTVPVSFFVAGTAQFILFPNAAALHHYWNWQFNPFIAIACGEIIVWIAQEGEQLARRVSSKWRQLAGRLASWAVPLIAFGMIYFPGAFHKFRKGRAVAGSFDIPEYKREYKKTVFAGLVQQWTEPSNGVAIHVGFAHRIEFESYMDRPWSDVNDSHLKDLPNHLDKKRKWVLIGDMERLEKKLLVKLIREHPIIQVDSYFFIDLGKRGRSAKVYLFQPLRPRLWWRYFVSPYDPPLTMSRVNVLEDRLMQMASKVPSKRVRKFNPPNPVIKLKTAGP